MPVVAIREQSDEAPLAEPALVFGQRNKLRADGPFLDLLRAFKMQLHRVQRLIVVGYSFRDNQVNQLVAEWINGDATRAVTVIDPLFPANQRDFVREVRNLGAEWLSVIEEPTSTGLPKAITGAQSARISRRGDIP